MNAKERCNRILNFNMDVDRLPMIEFAWWWDMTMDRWKSEGLPEMELMESQKYFGLDPSVYIWPRSYDSRLPEAEYFGGPIIDVNRTYDDIREFLFTDSLVNSAMRQAEELRPLDERGEIVTRVWLDGFFWFPRTIFGIEPHFYAFYDSPELMQRMNSDLADFNIRVFDAIYAVIKPEMVSFAEDMSYNHGPMLSKKMFDKFLLPYYRKVIPHLKKHDVKVFVDSDGDVTTMVPWLIEAGIEGVQPLERQAGVDLNSIRAQYPQFLMLGGYDKMVMSKGEEAMRAEFERLLPVMKSGGYIPTVDHQTPPEVSLENYKIYIQLFEEYARKAIE